MDGGARRLVRRTVFSVNQRNGLNSRKFGSLRAGIVQNLLFCLPLSLTLADVMKRIVSLLIAALAMTAALLTTMPLRADLRAPVGWWDPDGVQTGSDWHYRVPVTLPASNSVNSTATVDVNFATLMTQLSISGTFDINSVRVVRPNGTLAAVQEYTDTRFGGATDAAANNRGEVRWIVQDGGAQTYYIYFDITQNGTKAANAQPKINANFEHSTAGQEDPTGWTGSKTVASYDAQVRPNETVTVTDQTTVATDGNANTGNFSYLIGSRTNSDDSDGQVATVTRTFTVPATNPGNVTVRWKPQGWDGSDNGAAQWDFIRVSIVGSSTTELIGPTAGNFVTRPFAPNRGTNTVGLLNYGYGTYNNWDYYTTGARGAAPLMAVTRGASPWWTYSQSLAAYAGQTVTLQFQYNTTSVYRSWFLLDDIEWSLVTGTLGTAEGFGVAVTQPSAGADLVTGQVVAITAQVDARPTGSGTPVTANILNAAGTAVASGIVLFNDGTHGDAVANDALWTNNGSDPAFPTYTISLVQPTESNWTVRVFARDASITTAGGTNGHVKRNGQPNPAIEANYWNIDNSVFDIIRPTINITKISWVVSDPVNGTNNPKRIPGALIRYCVTLSNPGTMAASNVNGTDTLPATVTYEAASIKSGATCGTAATAEDDNAAGGDETDPVGASISGSTIGLSIPSLGAGASQSFTYDVRVVN